MFRSSGNAQKSTAGLPRIGHRAPATGFDHVMTTTLLHDRRLSTPGARLSSIESSRPPRFAPSLPLRIAHCRLAGLALPAQTSPGAGDGARPSDFSRFGQFVHQTGAPAVTTHIHKAHKTPKHRQTTNATQDLGPVPGQSCKANSSQSPRNGGNRPVDPESSKRGAQRPGAPPRA
jgi:hypothetical protein